MYLRPAVHFIEKNQRGFNNYSFRQSAGVALLSICPLLYTNLTLCISHSHLQAMILKCTLASSWAISKIQHSIVFKALVHCPALPNSLQHKACLVSAICITLLDVMYLLFVDAWSIEWAPLFWFVHKQDGTSPPRQSLPRLMVNRLPALYARHELWLCYFWCLTPPLKPHWLRWRVNRLAGVRLAYMLPFCCFQSMACRMGRWRDSVSTCRCTLRSVPFRSSRRRSVPLCRRGGFDVCSVSARNVLNLARVLFAALMLLFITPWWMFVCTCWAVCGRYGQHCSTVVAKNVLWKNKRTSCTQLKLFVNYFGRNLFKLLTLSGSLIWHLNPKLWNRGLLFLNYTRFQRAGYWCRMAMTLGW